MKNNEYRKHIDQLIIRRANERRERAAGRALNPDALRLRIPFHEWCHIVYGIDEPERYFGRFHGFELFKEYEIDCVRFGFEPDHPAQYGFYNTLYRHD